MSDLGKGNFTDNGVHEQGTDETRIAYQNDTPGQAVDQYIKERNKAYHEEAKENKKKHFSQVFGNPLKNFPYNEEFEVSLKEELELSESKIVLTKVMFDALSKMGVDKLMKKHDAYINKKESDKEYTTISTPSAGFGGELSKLIKKNKSKLKKLVPEEVELEENADKSLRKKADKTGIPFGILKKVYNRGVAAWKTGHRPGTTPEQWGHARVNSFATKSKGTWGGADKDLAKQVG
jgi:hypothetical protein